MPRKPILKNHIEPDNNQDPADNPTAEPDLKQGSFWRKLYKPGSKKDWLVTSALGVAALLLIVFAIPYTRYGVMGQVFKRDIVVSVQDSRTHKPVSDVEVVVGSKKIKTDAKGQAKLAQVPVGGWEVAVNKKYYNLVRQGIDVPLFGKVPGYKLDLVAIGSQVTVKLTNKITGKPIVKGSIAALGTTATTDANGEAVIVLPAKRDKEPGTAKATGYNDLVLTVQNTETNTTANSFALTPSGKIYFLSKRTGKINVMKSDLDGGNPEVVLSGTGREDEYDTILLATRDWKYLALKAKRDSENAKLYVIDTADDRLSPIDQGNATFTLSGWLNENLIYQVGRSNTPAWQSKQIALKSYNAATKSLKTLDETNAIGTQYDYAAEFYSSVYLLNTSIVFVKDWGGNTIWGYQFSHQNVTVQSVSTTGENKKVLKQVLKIYPDGISRLTDSAPVFTYIQAKIYEPNEIIFQIQDNKQTFYKLVDGKVADASDINTNTFNQFYPTYVQSPSGKHTLWYESRDGKNTLFTGDDDGEKAKEIASLSEFSPYGWYTDDYILLSKKGSELYIAPSDLSTTPVKVTDYHKPNFNGAGYGGGYGGN